jgi:solute carrier family 25 oxoglutarate transporter 11
MSTSTGTGIPLAPVFIDKSAALVPPGSIPKGSDLPTPGYGRRDPAQPSFVDKVMPFMIGGASGMFATTIIQPIDMVKVRIQLKSEKFGKSANVSPVTIFNEITNNGKNYRALYKGLDSALVRQITYTTTRLGIYKSLFNHYSDKYGAVSMKMKSLFGITAGFIGALVGNPADLILIRLQSDATLPDAQKRHYTGFTNAFSRIIKEEGVLSLWRGSFPTIVRAMVLNFGMLGPFDEVKETLNRWRGSKDVLSTRLSAAAVAGFLSSFLSLPFDNAKTKIQKMAKLSDGTFPYKNVFDCISKTLRSEGLSKLWVGYPTYYFRIAPHVMLTLMAQDYLTLWDKKIRGK